MSLKSFVIVSAGAAVLAATPPVLAADYDPPIFVEEAAEYVPVEVGSGWYLRGDLGYAFNKPYKIDVTPVGLTDEYQPFSGSVGMGYHFNDFLRGELNVGLLPTSRFDNAYTTTCSGTQTTTVVDNSSGTITSQVTGVGTRPCDGMDRGSNKAYDFMANAYVDLGTYVGITPYIGGGLGLAYNKYRLAEGARDCLDQTTTTVGGGNTTTINFDCYDDSFYEGAVTSESQIKLVYSLAAGLSYRVDKNASIDLGYEYLAIPDANYVTYNSALATPEIRRGIGYHQVKVGFRYDLW